MSADPYMERVQRRVLDDAGAAKIETQRRIELGYLRERMVNDTVQRKVDRNPNVADEQIDQWTNDGYRRWRETYPALASMFPSVLPESEQAS